MLIFLQAQQKDWLQKTAEHPILPGGVLPYMGYTGMCGPKGKGFSAVLVINGVSIFVYSY